MLLEVGPAGKLLMAVVASKGLLARVDALVPNEVGNLQCR